MYDTIYLLCFFIGIFLNILYKKGVIVIMDEKKESALAIAGLVLGIIAIVFSVVPFVNIFSCIMGLLALIFSIISLIKKRSLMRFVTLILGVLSIVSCIYVNNLFIRRISNSLNSGSSSANGSSVLLPEIKEKKDVNDSPVQSSVVEEKKYIKLGETITTKDWEITIDSAQFSQKVEAPQQSGYFSHYYQVGDSDNTYLYVVLNCKNISTLDMMADKVADVNVKYKNDYQYSSFSAMPDRQLGFTYTNITSIKPLTSDKIYYLSEMPKSIEDDTDSPIEIYINVNSETFIYKYR